MSIKRLLKVNGGVVGKINGHYVSTVNGVPVQSGRVTTYTIEKTITNGSASGASTIDSNSAAIVTIVAGSNYNLPSTIIVNGVTGSSGSNGVTWSYNSSTGVVALRNPTGNVMITAACDRIVIYPVKGDLITMNLGNATPAAGIQNTYRVLKINGSIAEVVAMYDIRSQRFSNSSSIYVGSDLDTYLNITWYNTLSSTAKNAIVSKSVQQYGYYFNSSVYNSAHASYADYSTKASIGSSVSRNVYALDVEDIEEYFGNKFSTANIFTLFWNTTSAPDTITDPWLRSSRDDTSGKAWYIFGIEGRVDYGAVFSTVNAARPALTIDLSKIDFSIS